MGQPANFPEANSVQLGFERDDGPDVEDLPVLLMDGAHSVSCWRLTWRERLAVLFTGVAWLSVIGRHPPVSVGGCRPFVLPDRRARP